MRYIILAFALSVLQHASHCEAADPLPSVDTHVRQQSGDWIGKRLDEIVPSDHIKKIVLVHEYQLENDFLSRGYAGKHDLVEEAIQKGYDHFIADLMASDEKADKDSIYPYETLRAEFVVLTDEGRFFMIEVLGTFSNGVSAISIYNSEGRARIPVKDYHPRKSVTD